MWVRRFLLSLLHVCCMSDSAANQTKRRWLCWCLEAQLRERIRENHIKAGPAPQEELEELNVHNHKACGCLVTFVDSIVVTVPILSCELWILQYFFKLFIPSRVTRLKLPATLQSTAWEQNTHTHNLLQLRFDDKATEWHRVRVKWVI